MMKCQVKSLSARRAWIEIMDDLDPSKTRKSLSARRAWIEIIFLLPLALISLVALRKESVDRNAEDWLDAGSLSRSLSARRAWIEMRVSAFIDYAA